MCSYSVTQLLVYSNMAQQDSEPKRCCICGDPVSPPYNVIGQRTYCAQHFASVNKPHPGTLTNVVFGGPNLDWLYATAGDRVYRRPMRRKGFFPWEPVKPPRPGL